MLDPNSPQVQSIWNLFVWSIGIGSVVFVLVSGLIFYVVARYRHKVNDGSEPRQVSGNTRLEVTWTVLPALLLVGLFIPTVMVMRDTNPSAEDVTGEPDIVVRGYQWWWRIEYPQAGIVSANEIHIPVGERLLVRLEADDVIHNFWVPDLVPKQYMIPGRENFVWLQANEAGVYNGVCGEYCGLQHAKMWIKIVAQPAAEYDAWIADNRGNQIDPPPTDGLAAVGQELYNELTCVNCHAIGGAGGAVGVGPNLTNFGSRLTIGAGTVPNTPEHLATWLVDPDAIKRGVYMPGYGRSLTDEQIAALVAYLESLR